MTGVRREVAIEVAAPADRLWEPVSDVTRTGQSSPGTIGGARLTGAVGHVAPASAAVIAGGRVPWSTTCGVIASEPDQTFSFGVGTLARPDAVWRCTLPPLADGRTSITESFERPRPLSAVSRLVTA